MQLSGSQSDLHPIISFMVQPSRLARYPESIYTWGRSRRCSSSSQPTSREAHVVDARKSTQQTQKRRRARIRWKLRPVGQSRGQKWRHCSNNNYYNFAACIGAQIWGKASKLYMYYIPIFLLFAFNYVRATPRVHLINSFSLSNVTRPDQTTINGRVRAVRSARGWGWNEDFIDWDRDDKAEGIIFKLCGSLLKHEERLQRDFFAIKSAVNTKISLIIINLYY